MKKCPNCAALAADDRLFCEKCGTKLEAAAPAAAPAPAVPPVMRQEAPAPQYAPPAGYQQPQYQQPQYQVPPVVADPFDHTAEFDAQDVSDNKVFAVLVYLTGILGVIVALLASRDSKYVAFHLRQELKFIVVQTLTAIATALISWTIIGAFAGMIFTIILGVLEIIAVFQVFKGQAKEPAIIRNFGFLK